MKIASLQIHPVRIPLRVRFSQSSNSTSESDSLILAIETTDGVVGYGESCPRPYVTGEDTESVIRDLEGIEDELLKKNFDSLESIREWVCEELPSKIGLASICALEIALIDAWCKGQGIPAKNALGIESNDSLTYSGIIPMAGLDKYRKVLEMVHGFGFCKIKLKVNADLDETLARVNLAKEVFGPDVIIRFDANCSWNYVQALNHIPVYLDAGVASFEQMFLPGMDDDMGRITQKFGARARIMADESVTTFQSAHRLISNRSCNHFNLKISKNGGLFNTLRIFELAKTHRIGCQLGAHFGETSILTAAGMLLAAKAPDLSVLEGAFGLNLLVRDICSNPLGFDAKGKVEDIQEKLNMPGLGFGEVIFTSLASVS